MHINLYKLSPCCGDPLLTKRVKASINNSILTVHLAGCYMARLSAAVVYQMHQHTTRNRFVFLFFEIPYIITLKLGSSFFNELFHIHIPLFFSFKNLLVVSSVIMSSTFTDSKTDTNVFRIAESVVPAHRLALVCPFLAVTSLCDNRLFLSQ